MKKTMYNGRISWDLYEQARQAAEAGHVGLDTFVEESLRIRLEDDRANEAFFTPEIIAEIREAAEEARTGNNLTPEQVEAHFAAKRNAWLANHPS